MEIIILMFYKLGARSWHMRTHHWAHAAGTIASFFTVSLYNVCGPVICTTSFWGGESHFLSKDADFLAS